MFATTQEPNKLFRLLFSGQSDFEEGFSDTGVVLFLGGDQLNAIILGFRLGFQTLIYAESAVMWPQFASRCDDAIRVHAVCQRYYYLVI